MATLTPPRANIPIGWVTIGGKRLPASIDPEWLRYLANSLFERGGGTQGSGTTDLETAAFEDAGIDDLKAAVAKLSDEASQLPSVANQAPESYDALAVISAEIDDLRRRLEALEQA